MNKNQRTITVATLTKIREIFQANSGKILSIGYINKNYSLDHYGIVIAIDLLLKEGYIGAAKTASGKLCYFLKTKGGMP